MGKADKSFDKGTPEPKMHQSGTTRGEKGESGEKYPARASNIDKVRMDSPKNGVGQGKEDRPRNQSAVMESIHTKTSDVGDGVAYHHVRDYDKSHY